MKHSEYKAIVAEVLEDHKEGSWDPSYDWDNSEYLELVEDGDWTQEHKYQYKESIYKDRKHNVFICINESRAGSYHSDWYYGDPDISIVEKSERVVTKTVIEWNGIIIEDKEEVSPASPATKSV